MSNSQQNLWPENRRRRERMVGSTLRAWMFFALRALIFALAVGVLFLVQYLARR